MRLASEGCAGSAPLRSASAHTNGAWVEKPNFFDVTVWGAAGENAARYLAKGRPVAVDGRLEWREWDTKEGGKRQAVEIIADTVQFLASGARDGAEAEDACGE